MDLSGGWHEVCPLSGHALGLSLGFICPDVPTSENCQADSRNGRDLQGWTNQLFVTCFWWSELQPWLESEPCKRISTQ